MKYFQMKQGSKLKNVIELRWLKKQPFSYQINQEKFEQLAKLQIAYYTCRKEIEIPDVLEHPTFMVSETVKHVMTMYEEETRFKGIQLYPTEYEKKTAPMYWIPCIEEVSCLHDSGRIAPNGTVLELVLDQARLPDLNIFKVGDILENRIIVSLPVTESILRRNPYGVDFEEVKIS